jgi:hypothetical protein
MTHEETYYGHRIIVTTTKNAGGRWTSRIEVPSTEPRLADHEKTSADDFLSEEEARRDALSRAAGLIDRARQGQGKP